MKTAWMAGLNCLCLWGILLPVGATASSQQAPKPAPATASSQQAPKPAPATASSQQAPKPAPAPTAKAAPAQPCAPVVVTPTLSAFNRLMLVPFENQLKDQNPAISTMALDTIQIGLLKPESRLFRLIDRRQVKAMLTELAFSESALSEQKNALKLGKLLSANLMLSGTVSGGKIHTSEVTNREPTEFTWASTQVSMTLTQVETGEILYSGKAEGTSKRYPTWQGDTYTSLLLEAVEEASNKLTADLLASKKAIEARL